MKTKTLWRGINLPNTRNALSNSSSLSFTGLVVPTIPLQCQFPNQMIDQLIVLCISRTLKRISFPLQMSLRWRAFLLSISKKKSLGP